MTRPKTSANIADGSVLARIADFAAKPSFKETYYYRCLLRASVPETLVDTFVCDIWNRLENDLNLACLAPEQVTLDNIRCALEIYATRDATMIRGLRPSTHAQFVRSIDCEERDRLAVDVLAYARACGVTVLGESEDEWNGIY